MTVPAGDDVGIHDVLAALDDDFMVFADRRNGLSAQAIDALEAELGQRLEAGYRRFLAELGCAAVLAKEEVWPRPAPAEGRSDRKGEWGFEIFGGRATGALPAPLDLRVRVAEARRRGRPGAPLLGMLGGRAELVSIDEHLAWVGARGGCGGRSECGVPARVEGDFEAVVRTLVAKLQAEKDHLVATRGGRAEAGSTPRSSMSK